MTQFSPETGTDNTCVHHREPWVVRTCLLFTGPSRFANKDFKKQPRNPGEEMRLPCGYGFDRNFLYKGSEPSSYASSHRIAMGKPRCTGCKRVSSLSPIPGGNHSTKLMFSVMYILSLSHWRWPGQQSISMNVPYKRGKPGCHWYKILSYPGISIEASSLPLEEIVR